MINTFPIANPAKITDARKRFLQSVTSARTDFAKEYLSVGRMQSPPTLRSKEIQVDHGLGEDGWVRKVRFSDAQTALKGVGLADADADSKPASQAAKTEQDLSVERWIKDMLAAGATPAKTKLLGVPALLSAAYTLANGRLGILMVNLEVDHAQNVPFKFEPSSYGLPTQSYSVQFKRMDLQRSLGNLSSGESIQLEIAPREMVLVEFTPLTADQ